LHLSDVPLHLALPDRIRPAGEEEDHRMKLQAIQKVWQPNNIITQSWHGGNPAEGNVYVALGHSSTFIQTPFISSHATAANWAAAQIGASLDAFARGVGACPHCRQWRSDKHLFCSTLWDDLGKLVVHKPLSY
jgi:hypothetical protein